MTIEKRAGKAVIRYSESFKLQVIGELEAGEHESVGAASQRYGIRGTTTVRDWLKRYGKAHLMKKVVRVEAMGEQDRVKALEKEVKRLKQALGEAHLDVRLGEEYLRIACQRAGENDVEAFKKKNVGML